MNTHVDFIKTELDGLGLSIASDDIFIFNDTASSIVHKSYLFSEFISEISQTTGSMSESKSGLKIQIAWKVSQSNDHFTAFKDCVSLYQQIESALSADPAMTTNCKVSSFNIARIEADADTFVLTVNVQFISSRQY